MAGEEGDCKTPPFIHRNHGGVGVLALETGGDGPDGDAAGCDKDNPLGLPKGSLGPLGQALPLQGGKDRLAFFIGEGAKGAGIAAMARLFQPRCQLPRQQRPPRGKGNDAQDHGPPSLLLPIRAAAQPCRKLWEKAGLYRSLRR